MPERLKLDYIPAPTIAGFTFGELQRFMTADEMRQQAARCPGCGSPSCQIGCPIGNSIGDFHTLIARGDFEGAANLRFNGESVLAPLVGSVCPQKDNGLCEDTNNCVAGRGNGESVMIGNIESSMGMLALQEGWIKAIAPWPGVKPKNKSVGIIGSGPAGLRAAEELVRLGWKVTIYESKPEIGGLLSIGIPNFKLNHDLLGGILDLFKDNQHIEVVPNTKVGEHISMDEIAANHDLIVVGNGAQMGRSQPHVPTWGAPGVYQAMRDYLRPQALMNLGFNPTTRSMKDKDVIVIGLGYTGVDCFNTAHYQGAKSVTVLSGRAPDPGGDMQKNRGMGLNQYILDEIKAASDRGVDFKYGLQVTDYFYDNTSKKCLLTVVDNGNEAQLVSDAIILARGFDIRDIIKPENENWHSDKSYNYKQGHMSSYEGIPVLVVGDAALHSGDRLVVKAAAQAANTVRKFHYEEYPEDNHLNAFIRGRGGMTPLKVFRTPVP